MKVTFHREDVKAVLRKRYGSAEAFQEAKGLSGQQVRDFLRGRSSKALPAIAAELGVEPNQLIVTDGTSPVCGNGDNEGRDESHGQNVARAA